MTHDSKWAHRIKRRKEKFSHYQPEPVTPCPNCGNKYITQHRVRRLWADDITDRKYCPRCEGVF